MSAEASLEIADGTAVLSLRAPQRRNALTPAMARELTRLCDEIDGDRSIGAVVVHGDGGYFCAGGARDTLADAGRDPAATQAWEDLGAIYRAFERVGELEPPTVAAIEGGAVGAGMNLALAADLRVVAEDARLTSGFAALGIHPGGGHGVLLGRAGSREAASALGLFGESVSGAQAVAAGLAWCTTPSGKTLARSRELAAVPAADPPLARRVARSLRTQWGPPPLPWPAALELERSAQMWSMRRKHTDES